MQNFHQFLILLILLILWKPKISVIFHFFYGDRLESNWTIHWTACLILSIPWLLLSLIPLFGIYSHDLVPLPCFSWHFFHKLCSLLFLFYPFELFFCTLLKIHCFLLPSLTFKVLQSKKITLNLSTFRLKRWRLSLWVNRCHKTPSFKAIW